MTLSAASRFQLTPDLAVCRVLNGMWQVSGGHGAIEPGRAVEEMFAYHDAGFTTWDLADHYGPAEDSHGDRRRFAARNGPSGSPEIQAFTKCAVSGSDDAARRRRRAVGICCRGCAGMPRFPITGAGQCGYSRVKHPPTCSTTARSTLGTDHQTPASPNHRRSRCRRRVEPQVQHEDRRSPPWKRGWRRSAVTMP